MSNVLPIPEVTYGEGFEVREAAGENAYVDFENKQFVVPFGNSPRESFIRAHENGHHITPNDWITVAAGIENRTLQALEDCRVNGYLRRIGIDTSPAPAVLSPPQVPFDSDLEACRSLVGMSGRWEEAETRSLVRMMPNGAKIESIADEVISRLANQSETPAFSETCEAARYLTDAIAEQKQEHNPGTDGASGNDSGEQQPGEGSGASGDESQDGQNALSEASGDPQESGEGNSPQDGSKESQNGSKGSEVPVERNPEDLLKPFKPGGGDAPLEKLPPLTEKERKMLEDASLERLNDLAGKASWQLGDPIPAEVKHPKLSKPMPRKRSLGKRPDETGDVPRYMHRYCSDGRIFSNQRMAREAVAILIDVSGSMQLRTEDIQTILDEVPASIIAMYSAKSNGKTGTITVLAHNGRMVDGSGEKLYWLISASGRQNICDVAAIEWLAARKERRKLWVSDALVTGKKNGEVKLLAPKWLRHIARLILKHRIVRVQHLGDLLKHRGQLLNPHVPVTYLPPKRGAGGYLRDRRTGEVSTDGSVK